MQEILLKIRYFNRGLSKTLKKLMNPITFNGQSYQKKGLGTSDQSFFRLQNKSRNLPLLVMYCLTKFDDVIERGF